MTRPFPLFVPFPCKHREQIFSKQTAVVSSPINRPASSLLAVAVAFRENKLNASERASEASVALPPPLKYTLTARTLSSAKVFRARVFHPWEILEILARLRRGAHVTEIFAPACYSACLRRLLRAAQRRVACFLTPCQVLAVLERDTRNVVGGRRGARVLCLGTPCRTEARRLIGIEASNYEKASRGKQRAINMDNNNQLPVGRNETTKRKRGRKMGEAVCGIFSSTIKDISRSPHYNLCHDAPE